MLTAEGNPRFFHVSLQTCVPGFVLYLYGYGTTYLLFGPMMAVVYEVAQDIPFTALQDFAQGTPLAEFIWGMLTWATLGLVIITAHYGASHSKLPAASWFPGPPTDSHIVARCVSCVDQSASGDAYSIPNEDTWRQTRLSWTSLARRLNNYSAHVMLLLLEAVLLGSGIWYSGVANSDPRNKFQTLFGTLFVATTALALHLGHFIFVACFLGAQRRWSTTAGDTRERILHKLSCGCRRARVETRSYLVSAAVVHPTGTGDDESQIAADTALLLSSSQPVAGNKFSFLSGRLASKSRAKVHYTAEGRKESLLPPATASVLVLADEDGGGDGGVSGHRHIPGSQPLLSLYTGFLQLLCVATVCVSLYGLSNRG